MTDHTNTSSGSAIAARRAGDGRWRVPWMPGRDLTEHEAAAAVAVAERNPARLGPVQTARYLALAQFQLDRARTMPGFPPPDTQGRWTREAARQIAEQIGRVLAYAGTVPDLGAFRAAEYLTGKLDRPMTAAGVVELARQGRLATAGAYKGHTLYDGRALESFDDTAAATRATETGRELNADDAAALLCVRRADFDHLTRAGLLTPMRTYRTRFGNTVALYRAGDLTDLEHDRPDIDWAAVRATPKGRPSPLAALPTTTDQPPQKGGDRT
ncbi:hypothetical protein GCM10027447_02020 [Glycomyces halotolerans]